MFLNDYSASEVDRAVVDVIPSGDIQNDTGNDQKEKREKRQERRTHVGSQKQTKLFNSYPRNSQ